MPGQPVIPSGQKRIGRSLPIALVALAMFSSLASGQEAQGADGPLPGSPATEVPPEFIGAWQIQINGRLFKLKTNYDIELRITEGKRGSPPALVSYFAGDEQRPSTICRTQLSLFSTEAQNLVFEESLNYKTGKDACPIWDQVVLQLREGNLWVQWRDVGRRRAVVKMEGIARRSTGGRECRQVGGDTHTSSQLFCRTEDGDWVPAAT